MTAHNKSLTETLDASDSLIAANPALAVADTVRTMASTLLRFTRMPWRFVTFELGPEFAYLEPGDWVWSAHELLPEPPQGYEPWRLIPLYVVEVSDPLAEAKLTVKCADLRETWCTFWSPFLTEVGMTPDLNGIAMLDRSGGWETDRDQVGYGVRPPGDDAWQEVLADQPIVDSFGLRIEGGGSDVNHLLNSTFSEGSGDTFTSWTKTTTGGASGVGWTLYTLIDANGFRRAIQLVTTAAGEQSYVSQTVAGMENNSLVVKVYYKDGGAVDRMVLRISRSDTGQYWRDSDGTWQAGAQDITLTPGSGVIDTVRFVSKMFTVTTGGAASITVAVGHFSAAYSATQISGLQGVELIEPLRRYYAFRSPLPTKAAAVTRVLNRTWIVNDSAVRVLSPTRGFLKCTITPLWSHSDLASSDVKRIWSAEFDGGLNIEFLRCYYDPLDAANGRFYFTNGDGEEAYVALGNPDLPVAGEQYTVICRWTSEAENEHGLEGQALDIWLVAPDGTVTRGTGVTGCTTQIADAACDVHLGGSPVDTELLDGHITYLTIGDHCPTEAELLRL